jgi:choice-of-anchor A domain-containing protein
MDQNLYNDFLLFSLNTTSIHQSDIWGELGSKSDIQLIDSHIGGNENNQGEKCVQNQKWSVLSGNRLSMDNSIAYGPVKNKAIYLNELDFQSRALEFSKMLAKEIKQINIGPSFFKCIDKLVDASVQYPVENYLDSTCSMIDYKEFYVNGFDHNQSKNRSKTDFSNLKTIELKGNELLYNVFNIDDWKMYENKTLRFNIPYDSYAILNVYNSKHETIYLNRIMFDDNQKSALNQNKFLFNFLNEGDVKFLIDENLRTHTFDGSILAPLSNLKISGNDASRITVNGQIIAKNIQFQAVIQNCNLFEPFF